MSHPPSPAALDLDRLAQTIDSLPDAVELYDSARQLVLCNDVARTQFADVGALLRPGVTLAVVEAARGRHIRESVPGAARTVGTVRLARREEETMDGRWFEVLERDQADGSRTVIRRDVSTERHAERALQTQSLTMRAILDNLSQGLSLYGADLRLIAVNRRWIEILDIPPYLTEPGTHFTDILRYRIGRGDFPGEDPDTVMENRLTQAHETMSARWQKQLANGRTIDATVTRLPDGRLLFTISDVSTLVRNEERLAQQSRLLQATLNAIDQGISVLDRDARLIVWNERFAELFDLPAGLMRHGTQLAEFIRFNHARGEYPGLDLDTALILRQAEIMQPDRRKFTTAAPQGRTVEISRFPMADGGIVSTYLDITEREHVAQALRDREARLAAILGTVTDAIFTVEASGRIESANAAAARLFGYPETVLTGLYVGRLLGIDPAVSPWGGLPRGTTKPQRLEREGLRASGEKFPVEWSLAPIQIAAKAYILVTARDLSNRRQAEEQLRQAQKMEAIGQLTGGVAHDFNNLLTVIVGNLQWLDEKLDGQANLQRLSQAAIRAAMRGADLTQRLLAFSRRQALTPQLSDPNKLVQGVAEIAGRTLGQGISVELRLSEPIWPVQIDRNQLENALINLAVNARDAMPDGGVILLETRNIEVGPAEVGESGVPDGEWVQISVRDCGTGMPPEILARAFEPFFTTKETGKGSGLGLSMVYGFVTQSGGMVKLDSRPGAGTTVRLLLPRAQDGLTADAEAPPVRGAEGHGEVILVVEDHAEVRRLAVTILRNLNYDVLEAGDAAAALKILSQGQDIDLLFTDLILPGGINGAELAAAARLRQPDLKVLFTTGYAGTTLDGMTGGGEILLKPYRRDALAQRLRRILSE